MWNVEVIDGTTLGRELFKHLITNSNFCHIYVTILFYLEDLITFGYIDTELSKENSLPPTLF